jgi:hypothetical protein
MTNNDKGQTTMESYTFTVCQDCIMAIVNADTTGVSDDRYDEWSEYHNDGMAQWSWVSPGRRHGEDHCGEDHGDADNVTRCETIEFDDDPCGICSTTLAGYRYYVTAERATP